MERILTDETLMVDPRSKKKRRYKDIADELIGVHLEREVIMSNIDLMREVDEEWEIVESPTSLEDRIEDLEEKARNKTTRKDELYNLLAKEQRAMIKKIAAEKKIKKPAWKTLNTREKRVNWILDNE